MIPVSCRMAKIDVVINPNPRLCNYSISKGCLFLSSLSSFFRPHDHHVLLQERLGNSIVFTKTSNTKRVNTLYSIIGDENGVNSIWGGRMEGGVHSNCPRLNFQKNFSVLCKRQNVTEQISKSPRK